MHRLRERLFAAILAAFLLATAFTAGVLAEDRHVQPRSAYGMEDDSGRDAEALVTCKKKNKKKGANTPAVTVQPGGSGSNDPNKTRPGDTKTPVPTATVSPRTTGWSDPITEPHEIVNYLAAYGELPDNFITKKEARQLGWDSSWNYVGDVAPGKSIGGDRFGNYEGQLPDARGRIWYECDAYYRGKKRGAHRVLYSSDGLYFYTDDHYNTFVEMYPEGLQ